MEITYLDSLRDEAVRVLENKTRSHVGAARDLAQAFLKILESRERWRSRAMQLEAQLRRVQCYDPPIARDDAAAAYVLDRAENLAQSSSASAWLETIAESLARGEHVDAWKHGELDDLGERVVRMRGGY